MLVKPIKMRWLTGGLNYCYLVTSTKTTSSWLLDPAEPIEVLHSLSIQERRGVSTIANTHHHHDHAGGNIGMLANLQPHRRVLGSSEIVAGATEIPTHLQKYRLDDIWITCIRTPCHTTDSVCYYFWDQDSNEQCIFTGDTLFNGGVGKFFEGDGYDMYNSLNRQLLAVIGQNNWYQAKIYPGHEYSKNNVKFARKCIYRQRGDNSHFDQLESYVQSHDMSTGCFTIADEMQYNPFLRPDDKYVRNAVQDPERKLSYGEVLNQLRQLKDAS